MMQKETEMNFAPIAHARSLRNTQRMTRIMSYVLTGSTLYLLVQSSWQMASFACFAFVLCRLNVLACELAVEAIKRQLQTVFNLVEGVDPEYLSGIFLKLAKVPPTDAEFEAFKVLASTDAKLMQAFMASL